MSSFKTTSSISFDQVCAWPNLLLAWKKASHGKRRKKTCANFEYLLADHLLELQQQLLSGQYEPGRYTHFYIHEPKHRKISAAPFRDRVVHHALCNVIEPVFEQRFIADSYANRVNKGTHKAIDRLQYFCQRQPYVLSMDIVKHFPSLDHAILYDTLADVITDQRIQELIYTIISSGGKESAEQSSYDSQCFVASLPALCRPRGLPIGNLTSQFWSNCYLHPLDLFIKRELGCHYYLRYVDDLAVFSDSKKQLWEWRQAIQDKLAAMRLHFHQQKAQIMPVSVGVPWLGFIVYPNFRRVKRRKVQYTRQRLQNRYQAWQSGQISFGEFDASVQGWINHVRYADSWGLRKQMLHPFRL